MGESYHASYDFCLDNGKCQGGREERDANLFTVNISYWKYRGRNTSGSLSFTFFLTLLVLLRWQRHPVVPAAGAALGSSSFRSQCKIAITKSPGMFLIHCHRPQLPSSLSAFALSRMYPSGFKCPGSSYCLFLSICAVPAWWLCLVQLTSCLYSKRDQR